jgi:hypothetical protein
MSISRFKKDPIYKAYENFKDKITRNPRLSESEKLKNPETIHAQDYLDDESTTLKSQSNPSNVVWTKCDWQDVKG